MKRIGILTTSSAKNGTFGYNYGAALQGYALVKQLRLLGYDAYDINYVSNHDCNISKHGFFKKLLIRMGLTRLILNISIVKQKIKNRKNLKNLRLNKKAFIDFISENELTYNKGAFFRIKKLSKISDDFYAFITGSDVVWNPIFHDNINDEGYFLDFVKSNVKRIAYAPSFGVSELPIESKKDLKELLLKFDALSIREKTGSNLIKKETGLEVPVVLDPTLLLEPKEYDEIAVIPNNLPEKYIVVYRFGDIPDTDIKIKEICKKMNLPIVFIPSNNNGLAEPRYDFGPGEFIGVIRNAQLVISDSFHCTIFSIINHTPFLTFNRNKPNSQQNINSRMTDLLNMINCHARMVMPGDTIDYDNLFNINFDETDKIIATKRKESLDYLKKALEGK